MNDNHNTTSTLGTAVPDPLAAYQDPNDDFVKEVLRWTENDGIGMGSSDDEYSMSTKGNNRFNESEGGYEKSAVLDSHHGDTPYVIPTTQAILVVEEDGEGQRQTTFRASPRREEDLPLSDTHEMNEVDPPTTLQVQVLQGDRERSQQPLQQHQDLQEHQAPQEQEEKRQKRRRPILLTSIILIFVVLIAVIVGVVVAKNKKSNTSVHEEVTNPSTTATASPNLDGPISSSSSTFMPMLPPSTSTHPGENPQTAPVAQQPTTPLPFQPPNSITPAPSKPRTGAPTKQEDTAAPQTTTTEAPVISSSTTAVPTASPQTTTKGSPVPASSPTTAQIFKPFNSTKELYASVDLRMAGENTSDSDLALTYGYPMGMWDVSKITDFSNLFNGCSETNYQYDCYRTRNRYVVSFNEDISMWDVSNAVNMASMFEGATQFNGNLSAWDVSQVVDMSYMFANTEYSFQGEGLPQWDVSSVVDMSGMFLNSYIFDQDISTWDVSSVREMQLMFNVATSFSQILCDWGSRLPAGVNVSEAFWYSGCPYTDDPVLDDSPPGPFCFICA